MTCSSKLCHEVNALAAHGFVPQTFEQCFADLLKDLKCIDDTVTWIKVTGLGDGDGPGRKVMRVERTSASETLPEQFVLKKIKKTLTGMESGSNEILAAEYFRTQTTQLKGPVKVLFVAQDEEHYYLATEYIAGPKSKWHDLLGFVNCYRLSLKVIMEIFGLCLKAVQALHERGIAHRDLSCENFVVAPSGDVRLVDLAQAIFVRGIDKVSKEAVVMPAAEGPPGKQEYRAPELIRDEPYLATKGDMFALGIVLYSMLTRKYPEACVYHVQAGRSGAVVASLRKQGVTLPPAVVALLEQLLDPWPALRPSVGFVLAYLEEHKDDWVPAAGTPPTATAGVAASSSADAAAATTAAGASVGSTSSGGRGSAAAAQQVAAAAGGAGRAAAAEGVPQGCGVNDMTS